MKKLVTAFFLCFLSISNAQDLNDWQVGFNVNPFIFTRLNPNFSYERGKQDFPNGFGFGLTIEKNWNEHWGIKTGFESTKQNEKYFFNWLNPNTIITSTFEYYKIPITIQYFYPLSEKLFLTFNQGIQYSNLQYFKTIIKDDVQMITFSSNYGESIFFEHPEENNYVSGNFQDNAHIRDLFGIIGSIGLKGFITDKITYSTNLRYEYDFSDADKVAYYYFEKNGNSKTNNFRLGLELGLQYHFSLDFVRFDNRPHKM